MIDRVEALRHCRVLEGFTEVGLKLIAESVRERVFQNAQVLQRQGEAPKEQGVLFVALGTVRCEVRNSDGQTFGLGSLSAGDHLGGMRLFAHDPGAPEIPSPLTAVAEGEVVTLVLDRPAFHRLQRERPQAAMKLLYSLAADFGKRVGEAGPLFADFAVYAGVRANIEERGQFTSYKDLGLDVTPTAKRFDRDS